LFFFSVLLTLIALMILVATGMHVAYRHKYDLKIDDTPPTGYESIVTQADETTITTNTTTTTTMITAVPVDEQDEGTPLITRPGIAVDSGKIYFMKIFFLIISV
jgi:hypothetical protein